MNKYYAHINLLDNSIGKGQCPCSGENIVCLEITKDVYDNIEKYIYENGELILDPDYEEKQKQKERERLDALQLTPSDVERALYKAKKMNFAMLKEVIQQAIPTIDMIALDIEFRATTFYRGATFGENDTRLFDVIGAMLGYTTDDMDYLFVNKNLPDKINIEKEETDENITNESNKNDNLESELEL